jgi:hypothetical protein
MNHQNNSKKIMTLQKKLVGGMLFMLMTLAAPGLVLAMPGMGGGAAPQQFEQETLQSFANASVQLQEIQRDYAARLEGIQEQEKAIELQQQANQEMVATVEEEGLDVQTYNAIANQMNNSPELKATVMDMIEQARNN